MALPPALTQASRQGRLLILWGALPFPLAAHPPADRALALDHLYLSLDLAGKWPICTSGATATWGKREKARGC